MKTKVLWYLVRDLALELVDHEVDRVGQVLLVGRLSRVRVEQRVVLRAQLRYLRLQARHLVRRLTAPEDNSVRDLLLNPK